MSILIRRFREVFEPTMLELKFMRKGNVFHKLINEKIVERVSILTRYGGHEFTIQFQITPLCRGFPVKAFMDSLYTLDALLWPNGGFWEVVSDECEDQLQEALKLFREHMVPFLMKPYDYQSAAENAIEMSKVFRISLYLNAFELFVACGRYEEAIEIRKALLAVRTRNGHEPTGVQLEIHQTLTHELNIVETALATNDFTAVEEMIREKEKVTLDSYRRYFKVKG